MRNVIYFLINSILLLLAFISKLLSVKSRTQFGIFIGKTLRILSKRREKITIENISKAFPQLDENGVKKICKESYHNLGITLIELLTIPYLTENEIKNYIKYDNIELINEAYNRNKGLIVLSGHFGNWELTAYSLGVYFQMPVSIIVKPQKNYISDRYLNKFRSMSGNKMIPMGNAARQIIKAIKDKETIAMLVDQSADKDKDIFVDFFGRPAITYEAPAMIALKYKCPIIIGFSHRQNDGTYIVNTKEIDYSDLDDSKESIIELTKRHVEILEDNIRKNPGHWAWQHKRWKHEPPKSL